MAATPQPYRERRAARRRTRRLVLVGTSLLAALAVALLAAPAAGADSASAQLYLVAHSHKLEARVQIQHECEEGEPCEWSAEVSAYASEEECPEEIELPQRVWTSTLRRTSTTINAHFQFVPQTTGAATLCLYVNLPLEQESELLETVSEAATSAPAHGTGPGSGTNPAGGGSGSAGSGPGSKGSGPGSAGAGAPGGGQSSAKPRTLDSVFHAFGPDGKTGLRTHTRRGYCFSGSAAADRRDAWRCTSGDLLADPCFSARAKSRSVVCPEAPWSHRALLLKLTRPLPRALANHPRPSLKAQPWAIELADGRRALYSSGATDALEGQRLNYFFGAATKEGLWGYPDRSEQPWTILAAPFGAQHLSTRVAIRHAWM
jgi:hypothetical protein